MIYDATVVGLNLARGVKTIMCVMQRFSNFFITYYNYRYILYVYTIHITLFIRITELVAYTGYHLQHELCKTKNLLNIRY